MARVSRWGVIAALQVVEALVTAAISGFWLAMILSGAGVRVDAFDLAAFGLAAAVIVHVGLRSRGAYDFADILNIARSSKMAVWAWIVSTGPLWVVTLLLVPKPAMILGWLVGLLGLVGVRMAAAATTRALVQAGWLRHNVLIIGSGPEAERCAHLLRTDGSGTYVVGLVSIDGDCLGDHHDTAGTAQMSDLQRTIIVHEVSDVIISTSFHQQGQLADLVRSLLWLPIRVLLWPPSLGVPAGMLARGEYRVGTVPLLLAGAPPLDGWHWVIKDVRDRLLAGLLLVFNLPVLCLIVLMIRLSSPGPILFRQQREGFGGVMFTIYKFRTMRVSDRPTSRLVLTARDDPRIFPFGALLRKTSLDELPQLLNIIRGDMWLVGPRPHSPLATAAGQRYSAAVSGYMARLRVKPGITGWAQVNGWRGPTITLEQIQQRLAYDLQYIERLSLWFDLKIILKTLTSGFIHKNAY